jgi:phage terminase large subunit-like protein
MKWEARNREAIWDNMELSLRSDCGLPVEVLVSATPTPHPWLRKLVADPACSTVIGWTDENAVNLEGSFIDRLEQRFGNTRKGRQERRAEILTDIEGAMFSQAIIEATRWTKLPEMHAPWFGPKVRVMRPSTVVAVDAAVSTRRNVDATAIVGSSRGADNDLYVRAARAGVWGPEEWAGHTLDMAEQLGTRRIVVERNKGGDVLVGVLRLVAKERERSKGRVIPWDFAEVTATDGKRTRADEVATMHEQGRVHFPADPLAALEDEITTWDPDGGGPSPNMLDALTWSAHDLFDGFGESAEERATVARQGAVAQLEAIAANRARLQGNAPPAKPFPGLAPADPRAGGGRVAPPRRLL